MNRFSGTVLGGSDRWPQALCGLLGAGLLIMLGLAKDLPMVDLPQHTAQLAAWTHSADPEYHGELFELNLRTPYLLAYALARAPALVVTVLAAFKLVIGLSAVGTVCGFYFLCRRLGHDPWMSLVGFPIALGYNFLYGFVSYIAAMPLALVAIGVAVAYADCPTMRRGAALSATLILLLSAHGIAFAQSLIFVVPLMAFGRGSWAARAAPVLSAILVAVLWLLPGSVGNRLGADIWGASIERLVAWPGLLVGAGSGDRIATWMGLLVTGGVVLGLGRPVRQLGRWLPLLFTALGYLAFPEMFRGYGPLWTRFAWLCIPGLMLAFGTRSRREFRARTMARVVVSLAAASWLGIFGWRLWQYQSEVAPWHRLESALPRGLRLRAVVFDPYSVTFPGLPLLNHLAAHYYVRKGGIQGYSFAQYPASVIRFRAGVTPTVTGGAEWSPQAFNFWAEARDFDCFAIQSRVEARDGLFLGGERLHFSLFARAGDWSAYCRSFVSRLAAGQTN